MIANGNCTYKPKSQANGPMDFIYTRGLAPVSGYNRQYGIPNSMMLANGLPMISFGAATPKVPEAKFTTNTMYADLTDPTLAAEAVQSIVAGFAQVYTKIKTADEKRSFIAGVCSDVASLVDVLYLEIEKASKKSNSVVATSQQKAAVAAGLSFLVSRKEDLAAIFAGTSSKVPAQVASFVDTRSEDFNAIFSPTSSNTNTKEVDLSAAPDFQVNVPVLLGLGALVIAAAMFAGSKQKA
jgi:hypothetical protein